jgi:glycosyltransferase involved in cell wall biosynthesis
MKNLLSDEEARVGIPIDKPTAWSIDREEREYALADRIVTLSTFALSTFLDRPALADKVIVLLSAVDTSRFRSADEVVQERARRVERGDPLRVLTVGTFSFQKGVHDLVETATALNGKMQFRFVGDMLAETRKLQPQARRLIDMKSRVSEFDLINHYNWADIFLFPTIQDGFGAVVAQAQAAGLAVIATSNCAGPDLVRHAETGWIVPIRSPNAIVDVLTHCDTHRTELAKMIHANFAMFMPRDWSEMAADLEETFARLQSSAKYE